MECEIENQLPRSTLAEDPDVMDQSKEEQDLDDIDVEAIMSRSRGRQRKQNFYEAPEFVKRLNAFEEVKVGETVVFACQWRALPKPAIKWYKDDEEITENERYKHDLVDNNVQQLIIEDCRKCDEGAYKCKAENQEGVASTTGYLSVTGREPGEQGPPPHSQSDHCISVPPPRGLRTIVEQKSLEEREEVEYAQLPPSPIQDFIDNATKRGHTWPYARLGYSPQDFEAREKGNDEDSDSDTSVESQEYDHVSFVVQPSGEADGSIDQRSGDDGADNPRNVFPLEGDLSESPPVLYSDQGISPFLSSSESEASSSDVSIPEISINTVPNRRKRQKRQPLQRATAIDEHSAKQGLSSKIEKDDRNKKLANGSSTRPLQAEILSNAPLADFRDEYRSVLINADGTVVERSQSAPSLMISSPETPAAKKAHQTLQEILGLDIIGLLEQSLDSPLLYYMLFTICCGFMGTALEVPVPLYVLVVGLMALVSFRVLLHQPRVRKY